MESLAKSFEKAHGQKLKSAFAETLTQLLHPIGKVSITVCSFIEQCSIGYTQTAQAEVNHPQWANAIEAIYPKASQMLSKPRYWPVAYPLAITSLCVAPHQFFLKHWTAAFEAALPKLKACVHNPREVPTTHPHSLGQILPGAYIEWNGALDMDLSISMPRKRFRYHH